MAKKQFTLDRDIKDYYDCHDEVYHLVNSICKYVDGKFVSHHDVESKDLDGFIFGLESEGFEIVFDVDTVFRRLKDAKKAFENAKKKYETALSEMTDKRYTIKKSAEKSLNEISKYIDGKLVGSKVMHTDYTNGFRDAIESEGYIGASRVDALYESMKNAEESYKMWQEEYEFAKQNPLVKN